jgi:hypothetical protein
MKRLVHCWNAQTTQLLRVVRAAIPSGGRFLVFDPVLPQRVVDGDPLARSCTLADVNMLANVAGRERSEAEFRRLLAAGGFTLSSAPCLPRGLGIVERVPA